MPTCLFVDINMPILLLVSTWYALRVIYLFFRFFFLLFFFDRKVKSHADHTFTYSYCHTACKDEFRRNIRISQLVGVYFYVFANGLGWVGLLADEKYPEFLPSKRYSMQHSCRI